MKVTMLGCGGSQGVPSASGDWGRCDPAEPRNRRRRPAVLIETETASGEPRALLIDTPPELREQLLDSGVRRIDAVLFTHAHADHVHGIDDLRPFTFVTRRPIPVHAEAEVLADIRRRFGYTLDAEEARPYRPILVPQAFAGAFDATGIAVLPFRQDHGFGPSTGFRIGNFAYSIDVMALDELAFAALAGVTEWIVDCQQIEPHPTHSHLALTLDWIARVKPRRAVLTHLGNRLDYRDLASVLPPGVEPGYDGLVLEI